VQAKTNDPHPSLAELQGAQRNDQLAAAPDDNAGSQT